MIGSKKHRFLLALCSLLFVLATGCSDETSNEKTFDISGNNSADADAGAGDKDASDSKDSNNVPPILDDGEIAILIDEKEYQLNNGFTEPISVQVPPNTIAMTITVDGDRAEMYGLGYWTGPDDFAVIPKGWETTGMGQICFQNCNNRIALSDGTFAAIAPNNPDSKVDAGTHTFTAYGMSLQGMSGAPSNQKVRITVMAKVLDEQPTTGILDMNLHFTGSNGWTAATAKVDPAFQQIMTEVDAIYQSIGVKLGTLEYRDVDPMYQVIESIQGADSDMMELFSQSSASTMNALNLFFVEEITSPMGGMGGGGTILGISGGIPGPPRVQGTSKSGVAVTTKVIPGGPGMASVIGHEAGHYLGLFHTTEHFSIPGFMPEHDPLPDTAENDESYLMHAGGSGTKLSPWQGRVIRSNPWVRHSEEKP